MITIIIIVLLLTQYSICCYYFSICSYINEHLIYGINHSRFGNALTHCDVYGVILGEIKIGSVPVVSMCMIEHGMIGILHSNSKLNIFCCKNSSGIESTIWTKYKTICVPTTYPMHMGTLYGNLIMVASITSLYIINFENDQHNQILYAHEFCYDIENIIFTTIIRSNIHLPAIKNLPIYTLPPIENQGLNMISITYPSRLITNATCCSILIPGIDFSVATLGVQTIQTNQNNPPQIIINGTLLISEIGNDWKEGKILIHFYNFITSNQVYTREFNVGNMVTQISNYFYPNALIKHLRIVKVCSINVLKKNSIISILLEQIQHNPDPFGSFPIRVRLFFNITTNEQNISISNIDHTTVFNCTRPNFINRFIPVPAGTGNEIVEFGNKYIIVEDKQIDLFNSTDLSHFATINHKFCPCLIHC
jgi:hypothetical protein